MEALNGESMSNILNMPNMLKIEKPRDSSWRPQLIYNEGKILFLLKMNILETDILLGKNSQQKAD